MATPQRIISSSSCTLITEGTVCRDEIGDTEEEEDDCAFDDGEDPIGMLVLVLFVPIILVLDSCVSSTMSLAWSWRRGWVESKERNTDRDENET